MFLPLADTDVKPGKINRWSCSIRLLRYYTCLNATFSGSTTVALRSAIAFGSDSSVEILPSFLHFDNISGPGSDHSPFLSSPTTCYVLDHIMHQISHLRIGSTILIDIELILLVPPRR